MPIDRVPLRFGSRAGALRLRGLRGEDEAGVADATTASAIDLLRRLAVPEPSGDATGAIDAAELTTADRDRALAVVYRRAFGGRVTSTVRCTRCEARFDLEFGLASLEADIDQQADGTAGQGTVVVPDGRRYRLPNGGDEMAVAEQGGRAADALLKRCALDGVRPGDNDVVPGLLQAAAPLLDTSLAARCPECEIEQTIRFDIQSYLLASILGEASRLVHEVHAIAATYGWSRAEILALPRDTRRAHVALIEGATRARRRVRV
jgi:hypothetical protein